MKSSGLVLTVVMALVAAGVYFGLQMLAPRGESAAPATEVAAPAAVAEPTPAPAPADEAPAPAAPAAATAAPAPAPEPVAMAEPAPVEKPKPLRHEADEAQPVVKKKEARKAPPAPDVIAPWWPDAATLPRSQLKLLYAGQTKEARAIALLFSEKLDPDSLPKNVEVKDANGMPVTGTWSLGKNEALAYFNVSSVGRYTVVLQPTLADVTQHMLGMPLQGPVYIQ